MARAKNRKTNIKRQYASEISNTYTGSEREVDDNAIEQDNTYKIPPELAPYALTRASQIPPALRKYWNHRTSLFSYFDGSSPSGLIPLLDEQSWFSITPEAIAARISHRCQTNIILDAFCGAGGNAIQFAHTCQHVIAIDIDPIKLLLAKHNAEVYGVREKITFLLGDWRDFVKDYLRAREGSEGSKESTNDWLGCERWDIDVIFLVRFIYHTIFNELTNTLYLQSPPWGGIDYRQSSDSDISEDEEGIDRCHYYPLSKLEPDGGKAMYELASRVTSKICMYLPRTIDLNELAFLLSERKQDSIDVEEQWLADRCKALACYTGPLVSST